MLEKESWLPLARLLNLGEKSRINHNCGGGGTLTIERQPEGYSAWCFRCNDKGWSKADSVPIADRLNALLAKRVIDVETKLTVALPEPRVSWQGWPDKARLWFLKAGLSGHDSGVLGAYYHPPTERVVLPVLAGSDRTSEVVFWQARSLDGRQPKYLAPPVDKAKVLPKFGLCNTITLTEDLLSAYKVGSVGEGWCLMGTTLSLFCLNSIIVSGKNVNVWLDPDSAGIKASAKILKQLRAVGVKARIIVSNKDPKLLHRENIKELLCTTDTLG